MRLNQDYILRNFAGQYYLFSFSEVPSSDTVIPLSETAAWILSVLEAGIQRDKIASRMTEEYEVDRVTAEEAVRRFLDTLTKKGILI